MRLRHKVSGVTAEVTEQTAGLLGPQWEPVGESEPEPKKAPAKKAAPRKRSAKKSN